MLIKNMEKLDNILRHNCGLVVSHSLHDTYNFLKSLQHRGREAAGFAAIGNNKIDVLKYIGKVNSFDINTLHKIFKSEKYHTFMAHVRYATRGRKDNLLQDAHPHVIGGDVIDNRNHIIIRNCDMAIVHNGQVNLEKHLKNINMDKIKTDCDTEKLLHLFNEGGLNEQGLIKEVPGAYTLAIADKKRDDVIIIRDKTGIKPGVLGWKDGRHAVVSEDIALRQNSARVIEDLEAGTIYYFKSDGRYEKKKVLNPNYKRCFFEWNYLAHKDSNLDSIYVRNLRNSLGKCLAQEFHPEDIDIVTYVPESPEAAAESYAKEVKKKFEILFYKVNGERSFQGPTNNERKKSIRSNLYLRDVKLKKIIGKTILVIDDSIVRGTNGKYAISLLKENGAKKIYFASYTPPLGIIAKDKIARGCEFGVDMPPIETDNHKFIARNKKRREINKEFGAKVHYISHNSMFKAFEMNGIKKEELCYFCIGGKHPFKN